MKRFLIKLFLFLFSINVLLSPIYFLTDDMFGLSHYELILKYQINKILNNKSISIGFFGDSSCGYAIDINLLNGSNINLSLTDRHTLCGTLEMIKLSKNLHPELDTVFIMQSFNAFWLETNKCSDVINYQNLFSNNYFNNFAGKIVNFRQRIRVALKNKEIRITKIDDYFENDYVRQGRKFDGKLRETKMIHALTDYNKNSILEIADFCVNNNLKYLFLIGPFIKTSEDKYYLELIEFFNKNEIKFERKHYILDNNNIGDTIYHVHPKFKSESTAYYKNLIHNYFKKNNSY